MEFRNRKHPRLKNYDYSLPGYYYITIHNEKGGPALSGIRQETTPFEVLPVLTSIGEIAQRQLLALEKRYPYVRIDKYVIMPTHIHIIIQLMAGDTQRPALMDIIGTYKSLTTRECNQLLGTAGRTLFQTSFFEKVLRSEQAYLECWRYIDENPVKWLLESEDM